MNLFRITAFLRCATTSFLLYLAAFLVPGVVQAREAVVPAAVKESDSLRLMALIDSSRPFMYTDPDRAIELLTAAYRESLQKRFATGIARTLLGLGLAAVEQGRYYESISLLEAARPWCAASSFGDGNLLINWYNNAAIPYTFLGQYREALAYYYRALLLTRYNPRASLMLAGSLHNNIGSIWKKIGQFRNSFYHLKIAEYLARPRAADDPEMGDLYASACNNLSDYYCLFKRWDSALYYNREALRLSEKWNMSNRAQSAYVGMGGILQGTGRTDEAIAAYLKAIAITDKTNPYLSKAEPYRFLAQLYYERGDLRRAQHYADAVLEIAERHSLRENLLLIHEQLALLAVARGDYRQAYHHKEQASVWQDSVINEEKTRAFNDYEVRYRSMEKDHRLSVQQLQLAQKENKLQQKNYLLGAVVAGIILLGIAILGFYRSSRSRQRLQEEQIRNLEKDREINRLKAVMEGEEHERLRLARELHDGIMSQLLAVRLSLGNRGDKGVVSAADLQEGLGFLDEVTADLRKTAHNLMPGVVVRAGLLAAVEDFCRKMDRGTDAKIHFLSCGHLPPADPAVELSLYRMIQELVQNAVKHAAASTILVQINCTEELLGITVEDDGQGIAPHSAGAGMENIRDRIRLLDGICELYTSEDSGTTVYMEIPITALKSNDHADQDSAHGRSPLSH